MKKENQKKFYISVCLLTAFILWTAGISFVDVKAIGPQNSTVGFAALNRLVHSMTGVHMSLYAITDWFSLIPLAFVMGFALLGLAQWIKRKQLSKIDRSILILCVFYAVVFAVYVFFEIFAVNHRPILIDGALESSYPSSTTMLVLCVMPTAAMQLKARITSDALKRIVSFAITAFTVFMVLGRLLSGVHWITDIIGGTLLSSSLVMMYCALTQ